MSSFFTVVAMVARRGLGHWRLLAALEAGVVLSVALMASVFIYSDAVRDLGLFHALATKAPVDLDIRVHAPSTRVVPPIYEQNRRMVDGLIAGHAGFFTKAPIHFGRSSSFDVAAPGSRPPANDSRPRAQIQFQDGFAAHTRIVAGRAPTTPSAAEPGRPPQIEVLTAKAWADAQGIAVGQQFALFPWWQKDPEPIIVTVSGLVEPIDPGETYWAGATNRFISDTRNYAAHLFWSDETTVVRVLGAYLPDMEVTLSIHAPVERGSIDHANAERVEAQVNALRQALNQSLRQPLMETVLADTLHTYQEKLFFTRLPLFALMVQIVGIVVFYVVTVGAMVVERQAGEIALLKSRGGGTGQVLAIFGLEAAGLCLIALPVGIGLAVASIALLGLTPPFHDLSDGSLLSAPLSWGALGLAAGGALLAFLALLWPAAAASRRTIAGYKQHVSRPPVKSAFQRYYLDLAVLGVAAFAFYQLRNNGSFVTERLFGGLSADPILLATPSLFMLTVALAFLRLFPAALAGCARLAALLNGPSISLGLTRMVRSPAQHSRLILLLILTTAVGVFAAGFRATLERGYADRAAYQAGAEVRLEGIRRPATSNAELVAAVARATGEQRLTPVLRDSGSVELSRFVGVDSAVLGVRADDFAGFAAWRDDFAGPSLGALLGRLRLPPADLPLPPEIPPNARYLGVWASSSLAAGGTSFGVRLRGDTGLVSEYRLVTEGAPAPGEWRFYSADLSRPSTIRATPDASSTRQLDSLFARMAGNQPLISEQASVAFDDLQASQASTLPPGWGTTGFRDGSVIEPFDDIARYETVAGIGAPDSPAQLSRATATGPRSGNVARLAFTRGRGGVAVAGLRRVTDKRPVPVVADATFLAAAKKKQGDAIVFSTNGQSFGVVVVGTFDLFPGFDPAKKGHLLLADLETLQEAASRAPGGSESLVADEVWLDGGGGGTLTRELLASRGIEVERVADRQAILAAQSADPLIAASWEGVLFLSFAAVLLLSALSFITYSGLSAQARSLEFAILRTMGFSPRQILGMVSFEQWFVIVAGAAVGTVLGFPLGRLMIDYMGVTEQGTAALPPLISRVSWQAVATVYLVLGVVVGATVAGLVAIYARLAVGRALRMGEL